jgi:hypothetical protein
VTVFFMVDLVLGGSSVLRDGMPQSTHELTRRAVPQGPDDMELKALEAQRREIQELIRKRDEPTK